MQFIIDNLLFVVVSTFVLVFTTVIIIKIVKEVSLNRLLREKHSAMRINIETENRSFTKRIGFLTSTALAPVAVVAIVITVGLNAGGLESGNQLDLYTPSDIVDIYDSYNMLLGEDYNYRSDDYSVVDSSGEESNEESPLLDYASAPEYIVMISKNIMGLDVIDESVLTEEALYQIDDSKTNLVISSQSDALDSPLNQMIIFASNKSSEDDCRREEYINGFYIQGDSLLVITSEYSVGCLYEYEGYNTEEEFVLSTTDVNVYVYDNSTSLELNSVYTFDGILLGTYLKGNQLIVITDSYIPYEKEGFLLDMHLPHYSVNLNGGKQSYGVPLSEVIYVDGVLPNTFISTYSVDLSLEEVDVEVLLIDDAFEIAIVSDKIEITTNLYIFEQASLVFDLENPIDELSQIVFTYSTTDGIEFDKYETK